MNKHPETGLAKPAHPLIVLLLGFGNRWRRCAMDLVRKVARQKGRREKSYANQSCVEFGLHGIVTFLEARMQNDEISALLAPRYFFVATFAASISSQNFGFCCSASSS